MEAGGTHEPVGQIGRGHQCRCCQRGLPGAFLFAARKAALSNMVWVDRTMRARPRDYRATGTQQRADYHVLAFTIRDAVMAHSPEERHSCADDDAVPG
jgi:hypothetical protein